MIGSVSPISKSRGPRASAPKSRNGCLTCKNRRVKCDEIRPKCNACIKSRRPCLWKPTKETLRRQREILPQNGLPTNEELRVPRKILPKSSSQLCQIQPSQALEFIDEKELYYFDAYQDEVASELAGPFKTSVWKTTMLREAHSEPFILRSLVALGALSKSVKVSHLASTCLAPASETSQELSIKHREFALSSYDKAIKGMQRLAISHAKKRTDSLRKVLIACILVHGLEMFLDSPNIAYIQAQEGYTLLRQLESQKPHKETGITSPDSCVIENEIYHELGCLDLRFAMWWGSRSLDSNGIRRHDGTETIKNMPTRFGDLEEAKVYQSLLMRRTFHLIGEAFARIMDKKAESGPAELADTPGELVDPCHLPTMLLPDRDEYSNDIKRWYKAFQPKFSESIASNDPETVIAAALLKVQALGAEIALAGAFMTEECEYDVFLPETTEIVALSSVVAKKTVQSNRNNQPRFNYVPSIHQPLQDAITTCRNKKVREEAIRVFTVLAQGDQTKQLPRILTKAKYLAQIEEKGRNEHGEIPESERYRMIWNLNHYMEYPHGNTTIYARRVGYPLGKEYPAKREWKRRTFTANEMNTSVLDEEPEFEQPFPVCLSAIRNKPLCVSFKEVYDELRERRPRVDV